MLTPEQVAEIRRFHTHTGDTCIGSACPKCDIVRLLRDRADIAQELGKTLSRKAEPGYSMTKALAALIERIK